MMLSGTVTVACDLEDGVKRQRPGRCQHVGADEMFQPGVICGRHLRRSCRNAAGKDQVGKATQPQSTRRKQAGTITDEQHSPQPTFHLETTHDQLAFLPTRPSSLPTGEEPQNPKNPHLGAPPRLVAKNLCKCHFRVGKNKQGEERINSLNIHSCYQADEPL